MAFRSSGRSFCFGFEITYDESMEPTFEEEYKKLNSAQREAVDMIEGPVMVIAGPGTGKTQILTLRIANILKCTDTAPEQILALTFTEAAVANMRKRLASLIGSQAYQVAIHTFHGFAEHIINTYPEYFPRIIGSRPITEVDQVGVVKDLIEEKNIPFVLLRPYGDRYLYVRDIVSSIGELKREGISCERFAELVAAEERAYENIPDKVHAKGAHIGKVKGEYLKLEKLIAKNKELGVMYSAYEKVLAEGKLYDFTDMIMEVLRALSDNAGLLQILQEEYQYMLVDEHQDTNNAQNKILELMARFHSSPNLFVVGDEKQAIFRFQGASLENFYYFRDMYSDAKLIALSENYRSTQSILDSAESLIASQKSLAAKSNHSESKIKIAEFAKTDEELYFVATDIKEKIKSGVTASEIAVLYRNNADAFPMANILAKMNIPYTIESDQDLFSEPDVAKFIAVLRAIHEYGNNEILATALHVDLWGIAPLDVYRVIRSAYDVRGNDETATKITLYDFLLDKASLARVPLENKTALENMFSRLSDWVSESHNEPLLPFLERVMTESGLLDSILKGPALEERMDALSNLFDEARKIIARKSGATLADFFTYIDTIREHNLFIRRRKGTLDKNKVRLMTVHRAKGLEFEYVYIIHAYAGHFGDKRNVERLKLIDRVYQLTTSKD